MRSRMNSSLPQILAHIERTGSRPTSHSRGLSPRFVAVRLRLSWCKAQASDQAWTPSLELTARLCSALPADFATVSPSVVLGQDWLHGPRSRVSAEQLLDLLFSCKNMLRSNAL